MVHLFQLLERARMSLIHALTGQFSLPLHRPFVFKDVGGSDELIGDLTLQSRALGGFVSEMVVVKGSSDWRVYIARTRTLGINTGSHVGRFITNHCGDLAAGSESESSMNRSTSSTRGELFQRMT